MQIDYRIHEKITPEQFIRLLDAAGLSPRRPTVDRKCIAGMLENSNLLATAWMGAQLIGVSRCVTDFHYCCYLADLAVDAAYQKRGVGRKLQQITQEQLGPRCKIILLAAPDAREYYPKVGYEKHESCWVLGREQRVV